MNSEMLFSRSFLSKPPGEAFSTRLFEVFHAKQAYTSLMSYCFLFPLQARKRKTDRDIHKLESELESLRSRVLKAAKDSGTGAGVRMETVLEVSWDWRRVGHVATILASDDVVAR